MSLPGQEVPELRMVHPEFKGALLPVHQRHHVFLAWCAGVYLVTIHFLIAVLLGTHDQFFKILLLRKKGGLFTGSLRINTKMTIVGNSNC
jgi:hypothetical protein